ncbi:MAG: hypothetical protein AB7O80_06800 [Acetobacteraceae bacterium]
MSSLHPFTPRTARILWAVFIAVLVAVVAAGLFIHPHGMGGVEETFGFGAWYGFATCVAMVVVSRLIGLILKRPDTYYDS